MPLNRLVSLSLSISVCVFDFSDSLPTGPVSLAGLTLLVSLSLPSVPSTTWASPSSPVAARLRWTPAATSSGGGGRGLRTTAPPLMPRGLGSRTHPCPAPLTWHPATWPVWWCGVPSRKWAESRWRRPWCVAGGRRGEGGGGVAWPGQQWWGLWSCRWRTLPELRWTAATAVCLSGVVSHSSSSLWISHSLFPSTLPHSLPLGEQLLRAEQSALADRRQQDLACLLATHTHTLVATPTPTLVTTSHTHTWI